MARWPDIRPVAVAHLTTALGLAQGRVATKVHQNVDTFDRFVRIARGPGSDDSVTDSFLLDAETFTLTAAPDDAWPLAEDVRQAMHALAGRVVNGVLIDSVSTSAAPTEVDYGNPKVVRFVASYRLNLRQVPS